MSPEKMVMMANQIATFFRSQPGTDQAARVASHLKDYWEPRMRQQLREHVAAGERRYRQLRETVDARRKIAADVELAAAGPRRGADQAQFGGRFRSHRARVLEARHRRRRFPQQVRGPGHVAEGGIQPPAQVRDDPEVRRAYLGEHA